MIRLEETLKHLQSLFSSLEDNISRELRVESPTSMCIFNQKKSNEKPTRRSREGELTQGKWVSFATDELQLTLVRKATSIQEKTSI
jgi:hypothetical protein